jgi:hypothetical protein
MTPELCTSSCKNKSDSAVKQLAEAEARAKRNAEALEKLAKNSTKVDEDVANTNPETVVRPVPTPAEGAPPMQAPAVPASFIETEVAVERRGRESVDEESEDLDEGMDEAEESESFAETDAEEMLHSQAREDLRKKVALLDALEREAFESGMALRRQGRHAFMVQSLAEAVPSTVYQEEGEEAYKKSGFDNFEHIADPREEMREYGAPKSAVEDVRDRVAARYANISTDAGARFHYDGADTDAPVVMFISYSPTANVTRKLSTAALSSLRHTLFLAPLHVKLTAPELVPVPRSAPANATTV